MLVEVGDLQLGANMDPPAVGLQLAEHQLQQRGFPAAVGADQGDLVAALDLCEKSFTSTLPSTWIVDVSISKTILPEREAPSTCIFALPITSRRLTALAAHRLQRADSAFVTGPARFNTLTDPHLFLGQLRSSSAFCSSSTRRVFFIEEMLIVISRIGHQLATIEVDKASPYCG